MERHHLFAVEDAGIKREAVEQFLSEQGGAAGRHPRAIFRVVQMLETRCAWRTFDF